MYWYYSPPVKIQTECSEFVLYCKQQCANHHLYPWYAGAYVENSHSVPTKKGGATTAHHYQLSL